MVLYQLSYDPTGPKAARTLGSPTGLSKHFSKNFPIRFRIPENPWKTDSRRRSGIGPKPALEAITPPPSPRAQRDGLSFPELPCGRRVDPAEPLRPGTHPQGTNPTRME